MHFILIAWLLASHCSAQTVEIVNHYGGVAVNIVKGNSLSVRGDSNSRKLQKGEVTLTRRPSGFLVSTQPKDEGAVSIEVDVPYGIPMLIDTTTGSVKLSGLPIRADIATLSGDLEIQVPWAATLLRMYSETTPESVLLPTGFKFNQRNPKPKEQTPYSLSDTRKSNEVYYGEVQVQSKSTKKVRLVNVPYPADAPAKVHWLGADVVDALLKPKSDKTLKGRAGTQSDAEKNDAASAENAVFRSDVRVVSLTTSVTTGDGSPILQLKPEDFEVLEDGVPQTIQALGAEEIPFNLALYLDLSGSTQGQREAMQVATKRFIGIAREQDQVAVYALANSWFHILTPLTKDRQRLADIEKVIPKGTGASPVYDTLALSYAEEFLQRPNERNALIAITDGLDNQLQRDGGGAPSRVSFPKLLKAAETMHATIYPVFLDPFDSDRLRPAWSRRAKENLLALAEATGGRLFRARSVADLAPVYPQIAEELRSVYSITYSPKSQDFNGQWRKISVHVKKSGAHVRTRSGYFAN